MLLLVLAVVGWVVVIMIDRWAVLWLRDCVAAMSPFVSILYIEHAVATLNGQSYCSTS